MGSYLMDWYKMPRFINLRGFKNEADFELVDNFWNKKNASFRGVFYHILFN